MEKVCDEKWIKKYELREYLTHIHLDVLFPPFLLDRMGTRGHLVVEEWKAIDSIVPKIKYWAIGKQSATIRDRTDGWVCAFHSEKERLLDGRSKYAQKVMLLHGKIEYNVFTGVIRWSYERKKD